MPDDRHSSHPHPSAPAGRNDGNREWRVTEFGESSYGTLSSKNEDESSNAGMASRARGRCVLRGVLVHRVHSIHGRRYPGYAQQGVGGAHKRARLGGGTAATSSEYLASAHADPACRHATAGFEPPRAVGGGNRGAPSGAQARGTQPRGESCRAASRTAQ